MPEYNGLQLINREVITSYLKQLLRIDQKLAPYTLLGLEKQVNQTFKFNTPIGNKAITLGGFIDRLDAVAANGNPGLNNIAERIRVIDYKQDVCLHGSLLMWLPYSILPSSRCTLIIICRHCFILSL